MEEGIEQTTKDNLESSLKGASPTETSPPATTFVKVEKNLASLGFFTPSSKRTRDERAKTVSVTIVVDGKRVDAKATIAPTALFGLPITADQDKWLALHKILSDIQLRDGIVTNPVSFSSAELLALLNIYKNSGKNYRDVSDWLDVMVGTTIISEGAVYFGGKRVFGKDTFHVFDRAVSFGKELPDGSIADKNYVWLSQWQLQNINDHHQLPIDLDTYRQLRNYISKALVPLLQVWLYATRDQGVFEKRYDELCQLLNIRQWSFPSKIKEKLGPSLDELKEFGYLSDWRLESTSNDKQYKVIFYHGEKFHRDRRTRLNRSQSTESRAVTHPSTSAAHQFPSVQSALTFDPLLIAEFTRRGITEKKAAELLANLKPGQNVLAQLELIDGIVAHPANKVLNPPGFYVRLIEANTPIPDGFETKAQRQTREAREQKERERRAAEEREQEIEWEYERYRDEAIDRHITAHTAEFEAIKDAKLTEGRDKFSFMTESMARLDARFEIRKQIQFLTFEEFLERKKNDPDFFLKPVPPPPAPAAEAAPGYVQSEASTGSGELGMPPIVDGGAPSVPAAMTTTGPVASEAAAELVIAPILLLPPDSGLPGSTAV